MSDDADVEFMHRAIELALASEQEGNLPVGAVITLDGDIIGRGYSAVVEPTYTPGRHAEIMALEDVDDALWPRAGEMTCYTTLEPCVMCAGTLLLHGIGRVVFGAVDQLGGAGCILDHLPPYYDEGGVYSWEGPLLPDECDPLYRRVDAAFEALPVGRSRWTESEAENADDGLDDHELLRRWFDDDGEEFDATDARNALQRLARRLEPDEYTELLPYARAVFEQTGYLKDYRALERYARRAGADDPFDDVDEAVRRQLPDVWIKKALERGEIDRAIDCWYEREEHHRARLCADELATACDDIDVVMSCRLRVVSYLVGRRARRHYRRACAVLRKLRDELEAAGRSDYWHFVVDDLRTEYDNLPALLDELHRAGFIDEP